MAELWMPGAERRPEGNGGSMAGGPPRAVWHITWDQLGKGGKMPSFDAIANYLKSVDFCPHLMWDPWTGRIMQFYPANQSARALRNLAGGVETNRQGRVCIQIETFFSPGAVVGGKKYNTVAETPCKGLGQIMTWLRSHGIPDVWPSGWPQWSGSSRRATNWTIKAGHYGHCHIPENDHTDPGPMPRNMFQEDDMPNPQDLWNADIIPAPPWAAKGGNKNWTPASYLHWQYRSLADAKEQIAAVKAELDTTRTEMKAQGEAHASALAEIKALLTKGQ